MFIANMKGYSELFKIFGDNKTSLAAFYSMLSLEQMMYEQQMVAYGDELKDKAPVS